MKARRRDHQHDIVFTNKDGIIGNGENAEFIYQTYTKFFVPKNEQFSSYYNEVFYNSIIGNGHDVHKYGDEWIIIAPDFEKDG